MTNPDVGDQTKFKYIGIHGYDKFQVDAKGERRDGTSIWIKDACRKDSDADYAMLTCFQRYVLDAMRRLRGLHGKNPPNNISYLCRALSVLAPDRPHMRSAIGLLVARSLLVLTNEPLHFEDRKDRDDKSSKLPAEGEQEEMPKSKAFMIED